MKQGREQELFGDLSSLEQFITRHRNQFETLTAIEIEVLKLLARQVSPSEICKKLVLTPNDLIHKEINIQKKLSVDSETDYIKYALAFGLISF